MALFVIGDLHLSLGADKPMDIFPGWEGYLPRTRDPTGANSSAPRRYRGAGGGHQLGDEPGSDAKPDFAYIQSLPGQKWLLKGNHDYWWTTTRKMEKYLADSGFDTLHILHNNACILGDTALSAAPAAGPLTMWQPRAKS